MPRARASQAQKKFNDSGLTFAIDMEEILEVLATGDALEKSLKDKKYQDSLIDAAFEKTDERFNVEAAAMGSAGTISHMFEWGTLGINRGRSNMRPNPLSASARLWHTFTEGSGFNRTLWYAYRPSLANVPKPTSRDTGMSSETIAKMKDHVFKWKAEVMEEGQQVTIKRKANTKFLLIPATESNRLWMRPNDVKRGYTLSQGPITVRPGYNKFAGSFTKFFLTWWEIEGYAQLQENVDRMIASDYEPEFVKPRSSRSIRPVGSFDIRADIAKKSKKVQTRVASKAAARRIGNDK